MKLDVFGKQRMNKEGKPFITYLTRMTNNKTGEIIPVQIKFRMGVTTPQELPITMEVDKHHVNMVKEPWENEDGETGIKHVLWVSEVEEYTPYVDHSLDDFE